MSTQHNPRNEADVTYTIVINEQQRELIQKALTCAILSLSGSQFLTGEEETVCKDLIDMIRPAGSVGPLAPSPAVNGLTL